MCPIFKWVLICDAMYCIACMKDRVNKTLSPVVFFHHILFWCECLCCFFSRAFAGCRIIEPVLLTINELFAEMSTISVY